MLLFSLCMNSFIDMPTHVFFHLVLAVSLFLGPILAVAVCVFGNFYWSALYYHYLGLKEPMGSLLALSLSLDLLSLVCYLDSVFWSTLCSHSLYLRIPLLVLSLGPLCVTVGCVSWFL